MDQENQDLLNTASSTEPEKTEFKVGGPVLLRVYCFMFHLIGAQLVSSMSYVPYVGESPQWFKTLVLVVQTLGAFHHFVPFVLEDNKKLDLAFNLHVLVLLPGIIFMFGYFGAHLPTVQMALLLSAFVLSVIVPDLLYKRWTGKEPVKSHSEIMQMVQTAEGCVSHAMGDTLGILVFAVGWWLVGSPALPIMRLM